MLDFLTKLFIVWIGLDVIILATTWYLATTIRPLFPDWWQRIIADDDPFYNGPERQVQPVFAVVEYSTSTHRGARYGDYQPASHKLKHPVFTNYDLPRH